MLEVSEHFSRTGMLGKKYPRVFQAESLEDIQKGRAEQARGLRRRVGIVPNTNFGSQPYSLDSTNELTAVIFLPEVQHYPAMDSQEDIKRLYGLTLHENLSMRLEDQTGTINVWHYDHSFLDFPYPTCFDDIGPGDNTFFNMNKWKAHRDISWKRQVILLAQYSELSGSLLKDMAGDLKDESMNKPVTEYYWLIHIFDSDEEAGKRGRERISLVTPKSVLNPEGMSI